MTIAQVLQQEKQNVCQQRTLTIQKQKIGSLSPGLYTESALNSSIVSYRIEFNWWHLTVT